VVRCESGNGHQRNQPSESGSESKNLSWADEEESPWGTVTEIKQDYKQDLECLVQKEQKQREQMVREERDGAREFRHISNSLVSRNRGMLKELNKILDQCGEQYMGICTEEQTNWSKILEQHLVMSEELQRFLLEWENGAGHIELLAKYGWMSLALQFKYFKICLRAKEDSVSNGGTEELVSQSTQSPRESESSEKQIEILPVKASEIPKYSKVVSETVWSEMKERAKAQTQFRAEFQMGKLYEFLYEVAENMSTDEFTKTEWDEVKAEIRDFCRRDTQKGAAGFRQWSLGTTTT